MKMTDGQTKYLASFIDELSHSGVENAVICPGSRSTPLAYLLAEHPKIKVYMQIDERSASFFALGMAKSTKKPVVLLCTSGTAAANFYPAIIEAYYSRVPLIVLTADRPHELRDVGAPQAIDQIHLYGKHVKWFNEMAVPEESKEMYRYAKNVSSRAVQISLQPPEGPVHINFPLREPLVPNLLIENLFETQHKLISVHNDGVLTLHTNDWEMLASRLPEKGLIICGVIDNKKFKEAVIQLSHHLAYPIIADPLSQMRSNIPDGHLIIDCYDAFLRNRDVVNHFQPEIIIRFGGMPVSKALLKYLSHYEDIPQIVVDNSLGMRRDPAGTATNVIYSDETIFCQEIVKHSLAKDISPWANQWMNVNAKVKNLLSKVENEIEMNEGKVVYELQKKLPNDACLFVANSMPIRDVDTFFHNTSKNIRIMANRGANGIDGVVSSALGASINHQKTVLLIGDLSFYHDLNGLLAAKMHNLNITIIVVNNNGGGIFSFLPQRDEEQHFELLFGTPTNLSFEHASKLYNGEYRKVENWEQFHQFITESIAFEGLFIIEVFTNREQNKTSHQELWNLVNDEISKYLKDV